LTILPPGDPSLLQPIDWPEATARDIAADVLRLDLLHPVISGNKWFKLKYHLQAARQSSGTIVTFGGAWSNHLVATACAAQAAGLAAIGIVRGERPQQLSATLDTAIAYGMKLEFISRTEYAQLTHRSAHAQLTNRFPGAYIIPEGGAGEPGIRGAQEILARREIQQYTHLLCAIGTGTMFRGLLRAAPPPTTVIGVPVLKGFDTPVGWQLLNDYHFGGYARHPQKLLEFMNDFDRQTGIPTDIVYTGKLFYAFRESIRNNLFPGGSRLLIIHSGGLQGNLSLPPGVLRFPAVTEI
jgi:1-aminocyclopropane-1-carboxylate deaminase